MVLSVKLKAFEKPKSAPAVKPLTYSSKDKAIFTNVTNIFLDD